MPTTELFAEVLIVGALALPWIGLVGALLRPIIRVNWPTFPGVEAIATVAILAALYAIGILVDRIADAAFDGWDERISQRVRRSRDAAQRLPDRPQLRFELMEHAPASLVAFLDYARSRRRIMRGLAFNAALMGLAASADATLGVLGGAVPLDVRTSLGIGTVSVVMVCGSCFAWWHIGTMYFNRTVTAYDLFVNPSRPRAVEAPTASEDDT